MNQQQQNQARPYKVDAGTPKRTYVVKSNGDVKMTESVTTTVFFAGREFITFARNHEHDIETINSQLSEEHKKQLETNKAKLQKEIDKLRPIMKDVEKKVKAHYEKEKKLAFIATLKEQLNAKKLNNGYIMAMWKSIKDEQKKMEISAELTNKEKTTLIKVQNNATKEQRGKR